MEKFTQRIKLTAGSVLLVLTFTGCVYFNTVYHAREAYEDGYKLFREEQRSGETYSSQSKEQFRRAVNKGKKILSEYSDSKYVDDAYLLVGKSYYYLEQYNFSRDFLEEMSSRYPESPFIDEARLFLGRSYMEMDEFSSSRIQFEYLIDETDDRSLRAKAYLGLADLSELQSNPEAMLDAVQSAIELAEDNEVKADAAWRTALWGIETKNYDAAEEFYKRAQKFTRKPHFDRTIQFELAQLQRRRGHLEEAQDAILQMLSDEDYQDLFPQLEIERGLLYEQRGDTSTAIEAYRYVTSEHQRSLAAAQGYYRMGELSFQKKAFDQARKQFQSVRRADRNSEFVELSNERIQKIDDFIRLKRERAALERSIAKEIEEGIAQAEQDTNAESTTDGERKGLLNAIQQVTGGAGNAFNFQAFQLWAAENDSNETVINYLNMLYQIAEMYMFELEQVQEGIALADTIIASQADREIAAKALLLKGYAYENLLDNPRLAEEIYDRIETEYGKASLPDRQKIAVREDTLESTPAKKDLPGFELYQKADSLRTAQLPDSSIQLLKSLNTTHPNTYYGGKSLYTIGWIFENQKTNLDSAIAYYQDFTDKYTEHELYQEALGKKDNLSTIKTLLATESLEATDEQADINNQDPNNETENEESGTIRNREAELERERLLREEAKQPRLNPDGLPPGAARPDSLPDDSPQNQRPRLQR